MMEFLSKPKSPCKRDCAFRDAFCKLDCDDYKEYEEKYKVYYDAKKKQQAADSDYAMYRKDLDKKFKRDKFRRRFR